MDKAEITVSPNIGVEMRRELSDMLGVKAIYQHSKYLELLTLIGWSKYDGKKYQEDERLEGEVFINRVILIKNFIQSIPSYAMNCFLLPITLCKEVD